MWLHIGVPFVQDTESSNEISAILQVSYFFIRLFYLKYFYLYFSDRRIHCTLYSRSEWFKHWIVLSTR